MNNNLKIINNEKQIKEIINEKEFVVIAFCADWCPPCNAITPIIKALSQELSDVHFIKINIEEGDGPKLKTKYTITSLPTLIYFKKGQEQNRTFGLLAKPAILKHLDNLKNKK